MGLKWQSEMMLRSALALTTLVINVTALVEHAGAQYVPIYALSGDMKN
jgi:hypothetical protein